MLAARVAAAYPDAELVLTDGAPAMLEQARAALGDRAQLHVADLADPLPDGPFDAVVSALAIHHLDDAGKQALFARVRAALPRGRGPAALFRPGAAGRAGGGGVAPAGAGRRPPAGLRPPLPRLARGVGACGRQRRRRVGGGRGPHAPRPLRRRRVAAALAARG